MVLEVNYIYSLPDTCCSAMSFFTALIAAIIKTRARLGVVLRGCSAQNAANASQNAILAPKDRDAQIPMLQLRSYHFSPATAALSCARVCFGCAGSV